jgi:biotin carboxyl carrier protein
MSLYCVSIGNKEYQVEIAGGQYKIDGQCVPAVLTALCERGVYLLKTGAWRRELHAESQGRSQYALDAEGRHVVARVERANSRRRHSLVAGAADLAAPMPGLVLDVLAEVGQRVDPGQLMVLIESMKMQMQLRADCAGTVTGVLACRGAMVARGDILIKICPD